MKKITNYFLVLACILAGFTLSMSSCVDDNESQSVTNIREGHAEKLKAEAALATAQADAAKIVAEAEVAFKAAEAQLKLAEAKMLEAQTAYQTAQTESDKEMWAAQVEKAKGEAKAIQIANEKLAKETEYELEQLKIKAETQLLELQKAFDKLKYADDEVLTDAINKYTAAMSTINQSKQNIARLKLDLTRTNALILDNIATKEEQAAKQIASKKESIANVEVEKENILKVQKNWETLLAKGNVNAKEEIAKLEAQKNVLIFDKSVDVRKVLDEKVKIYEEAEQAVYDFRNLGTINYQGGTNYLPGGMEGVTYLTVGALNISKERSEAYLTDMQADLKKLETAYAKAEKDLKPNFDAANAADKKEEEALTAYNKVLANPAATAEEITKAQDAYIKAQDVRAKAWNAYYEAKNIVDTYPIQIESYRESCTYYTERIANFETAIAAYAKDSETPYKLEQAYVTAYNEMNEARLEMYSISNEIALINNQIYDLNYLSYQGGTVSISYIEDRIKDQKDMLEVNDGLIAIYTKDINAIEANAAHAIASMKLDVEEMKAKIADEEAKQARVQKEADAAKAIIDERSKK